MEEISTLNQLKRNLNMGPGYEGYNKLMEAINLPREEYADLLRWSDDEYQRVRFYDTDSIEGLITCWEPGQKSTIHNYENALGWMKVLEGEIEQVHYAPENEEKKPTFKKTFREGEMSFTNEELGFHQYRNTSDKRTVLLVFFSDKIERWKVWDPEKDEVTEQEVRCDLNLDKDKQD